MNPSVAPLYDEFLTLIREAYYLDSVAGLLGWDQQTMMPAGAASLRAAQSSLMAGILHDRLTQPRLSELLDRLEDNLDALDGDGRVERVVAAHDVGRVVNPVLCRGQIEGSIHMGLGYALSEELVTRNGVTLNTSFLDYKIPAAEASILDEAAGWGGG